MRIGVVPKLGSPQALTLARRVMEYAEARGIETYLDSRAKEHLTWHRLFTVGRDTLDFIVVIGGDGTVLRTLHMLRDSVIPLITIRYGRRGFLCDVAPFEYKTAIDRLISRDYELVDYIRLKASIGSARLPYVLNEYAVTTSGDARGKVARLRVLKDEEPIYFLVGDGVIVAPPAGSTAYSLASGGPVVDPRLDVILITPLAPITFCSRAVVLPSTTTVRIVVSGDSPDLIVLADGIIAAEVGPGEVIEITKAPIPARFARFYLRDYYVRLFERCM